MTNDIFDALVLSRNYKAPIQDLATIESELATKGITNGTILFDTLLNVFIYRDNVTTYTGWNEIKLYPLNNGVQVKHYHKYNLKQTITRSLDDLDTLIKIAILP